MEFAIPGDQLTVEITESMMMEQDEEILRRIEILRNMGVGLSIDDFGTGFPVSPLVSLPVTELKIDKTFVDRCQTEKRIQSLLEAIISIGQSLNLMVIAEGVETKEQFELLRSMNCPVIQGYYFSRPIPADEIATGCRRRYRWKSDSSCEKPGSATAYRASSHSDITAI